jgi:hypothetical protein
MRKGKRQKEYGGRNTEERKKGKRLKIEKLKIK